MCGLRDYNVFPKWPARSFGLDTPVLDDERRCWLYAEWVSCDEGGKTHPVSCRVFYTDCPLHSLGVGAVPSSSSNFTQVSGLQVELIHLGFSQPSVVEHDGAPPHYGGNVEAHRHFNVSFGQRLVGSGGPVHWPGRSLDLSCMDFYKLFMQRVWCLQLKV
ncbi:hypothetical protein TNCV_2283911 [Trichonephila clavipes]|nr:hypothetical protein TNCV_2283911 [Trichonephila clavipes]